MLSTKHAMKWLHVCCHYVGVVMGDWGNLADVRVNTCGVRTETYMYLYLFSMCNFKTSKKFALLHIAEEKGWIKFHSENCQENCQTLGAQENINGDCYVVFSRIMT